MEAKGDRVVGSDIKVATSKWATRDEHFLSSLVISRANEEVVEGPLAHSCYPWTTCTLACTSHSILLLWPRRGIFPQLHHAPEWFAVLQLTPLKLLH